MPIFKVKKYVSYSMATHFQWYPSSEETVVPFNARYSFPSQINKSVKVTPRLPPVSGTTFTPGQTIKINFPAQGYMNPRNTTFTFDVTLTGPTASAGLSSTVMKGVLARFQNNIQSIFQKVRLLYGSTPLEDISNYNVIVRQLTEWTGSCNTDQSSINEGIGGVGPGSNALGLPRIGTQGGVAGPGTTNIATVTRNAGYVDPYFSLVLNQGGLCNVRQDYIQGIDVAFGDNTYLKDLNRQAVGTTTTGNGSTMTGQFTTTRRYQIQLALGLFTQEKLIPLKWMASQLSIELTLAPAASCIFERLPGATGSSTYSVSNFAAIPEILEFDASYDAMFLKGLREGGVPIKFSSWHTYTYPVGGQNLVNFIIPEKSRSVKSIFTIQRRGTDTIGTDSGAAFFSSAASSTLQSYQYRIGGRYFPASPVQCSATPSSSGGNGGTEAWIECQKALNQLGDARLSTPVNALRWALPYTPLNNGATPVATDILWSSSTYCTSGGQGTYQVDPNLIALNEADYSGGTIFKLDSNGNLAAPSGSNGSIAVATTVGGGCTIIGSTQFCCAIDLETSSGVEIAGLNAEEQSDISFVAQYSANQAANYNLEAYVYYDAMLVLRENNVLELIQ